VRYLSSVESATKTHPVWREPEPWITQRELAAKLRVSTRTVRRLRLPYTPVGGQNRYWLSEVEDFLRGVPENGGKLIRFPGPRKDAA
jgi:hypothetical protein